MQSFEEFLRFADEGPLEWRTRGGLPSSVHLLMEQAAAHGLYTDDVEMASAVFKELSARMAEAEAEADACANVKDRSISWYRARLGEPISAGSTITVQQACYAMAWLKLQGGMTVQSVDYVCRLMSLGGVLEEENQMPR